jgi:colicin import membrane protein
MPSTADRIDFGPGRDEGAIRSFGLALLVHAALIAALTWGVSWKRSDRTVAFEAELWSNIPQEAAPKLIEPPAPPAPPPEPKVISVAPVAPNVDIAIEQEKKRKLLVQQAQAEKDLKLKQEQVKAKATEDAKLTEAKQAEAKKKLLQTQANAAAQEVQRQQNIARAMGIAGATGGESAKGNAQKSSGPSASYGGKVRAKVKPNIVFTEELAGNPSAEVEVRTALDGTIMSQRLIKSSGNKAWDDAVVKAIIRTEVMPRDVDGRVPTPMILEFRPKD